MFLSIEPVETKDFTARRNMGWYTCLECGDRDTLQSCCGHSDERSLCDKCHWTIRTEALCDSCHWTIRTEDCGNCGSNFCRNHGNVELTKCCDQILCKGCNEDGDLFLCDVCRNEDDDEDEDDNGKTVYST
ncbi:hypothetical protein FRACYDRAFT_248535 [Fragilariopsis cylindrus CCMP1102]|uniref:Uncharacterized protein n=1 Tax=Fragilariopsis cylindrus CCMP1102 TaxID=635003 RepID=A0A1E7ETA4_9STRA|nr:hypothetical protein FRACYDRAFT_248535 [Fragilariopsis cylindrus CCMP1102]|eukprot:OEU09201.1 hypothetical protein FRACYDRAFT_248535 [Fragilariopsis cylindrus CCMP1102]